MTDSVLEALREMEERITTKLNNNTEQIIIELHYDLKNIKATYEDQERRISHMERQLRQKNILFFGVKEQERSYEELEQVITRIVNDQIKTECTKKDIEMVRRVGKIKEGGSRPINVTFITYGTKIKILKLKKNLEGSNIYIKEDFPPKVLEVRKTLQDQLKQDREEGKHAILKYDKIIYLKDTRITTHTAESKQTGSGNKKRPLIVSPPNISSTYYTKPDGTPNSPQVKMQANKKNKTMASYNIREYIQPSNRDLEKRPNSTKHQQSTQHQSTHTGPNILNELITNETNQLPRRLVTEGAHDYHPPTNP